MCAAFSFTQGRFGKLVVSLFLCYQPHTQSATSVVALQQQQLCAVSRGAMELFYLPASPFSHRVSSIILLLCFSSIVCGCDSWTVSQLHWDRLAVICSVLCADAMCCCG